MTAGKHLENFPKGRAADKVAKTVGKHRTTLRKAAVVVDSAEAEPKYTRLVDEMDRCGRVNGVYRRAEKYAAGRATPRRAAAVA